MSLSAEENERAKLVFDIYDMEGKGEIDAYDLGRALRAMKIFPTCKCIEKLGGEKKRGAKKLKIADFTTAASAAKADKDVGTMSDFKECLKLYDKESNGMMIFEELKGLLRNTGERLEPEDVDEILKDCANEPDEDGFIPWQAFLDKLVAGPVFKD